MPWKLGEHKRKAHFEACREGGRGQIIQDFWCLAFEQEAAIKGFTLPSKEHTEDYLGGPVVENPPANAGDVGLIPGLERFHMLQGN